MTTISAAYPPQERGTRAVIALTYALTLLGLENLLYSIGTCALVISIIGALIGVNVHN
jgi:hypothetical protein